MKCPLCTTKKGKRSCQLTTTCICSACCGTNRKLAPCTGCVYYQPPKRNYKDIPYYSPSEMDGYREREDISEVIESALATFDYETDDKMNDNDAIQILEMLLDVYYFRDDFPTSENPLIDEGFCRLHNSIQALLLHVDHSELSKILGAIWFVAKRRTTGKREYLQIIRQYVGIALGDNTHVRMDPKVERGPGMEKLKEMFLGKRV